MKRSLFLFCALLVLLPVFAFSASAYDVPVAGETRYQFSEPESWFYITSSDDRGYLHIFECGLDTPFRVSFSYSNSTYSFTMEHVTPETASYVSMYYLAPNGRLVQWMPSLVNNSDGTVDAIWSGGFGNLTAIAFNSRNPNLSFSLGGLSYDTQAVYFDGDVDFKTYLDSIQNSIDQGNQQDATFFSNVGSWFSTLFSNIDNGFSSVTSWFTTTWNSMVSGFNDVLDKLDQLVQGTGAAADKIKQDAADLSQSGSDLKTDIGKIDEFEDMQFGVLDSNLDAVSSGGDLTNLTEPMSWILQWTNHIVEAVPSNYRSYWTVPFFFGIFFLICQHQAGTVNVVRYVDYSSKPKRSIGFARDE